MIRLHASTLPAYADCPRRAIANDRHLGALLIEANIQARTLKTGIGACCGAAVDAGSMLLLQYKHDNEEWQQPKALADAHDAAIANFRQEITRGCEYDKITPNAMTAEAQIKRMVDIFYHQVLPTAQPDSIQLQLEADIGDNFALVGRWDWHEPPALLRDAKTGWNSWPVGAQMGAYYALGRRHGIPIDTISVCFIQRVALAKPQPAAESIDFNVDACKRQAGAVVKRIKRDISAWMKTGDIEEIPVNPMSQFCKYNHCPLYKTAGCTAWI